MRKLIVTCLLLAGTTAQSDDRMQASIEQLRDSIGRWDVVTEFIAADGSIATTVEGSYEFSWVIEDQLVAGRTEIPELEQTAAILFYIDQGDEEIEMVSVGGDGKLWIMSGPLGGETRHTQTFETADGGTGQLRFTRYNVTDKGFESRMEITLDGGDNWRPANHQVFRRASQ